MKLSSLSLLNSGLLLLVYLVVSDSPNDSLTSHSGTTVGGQGLGCFCLDLATYKSSNRQDCVTHKLGGPPPLNSNTTYWASVANPTPGIHSCAIATSNGAFIQTRYERDWGSDLTGLSPGAPDVMAVDWRCENVVIMGCKDGGVRLWDVRSPSKASHLFQHPSQINHAKCPSANTVVVAGLDSHVRISIAADF